MGALPALARVSAFVRVHIWDRLPLTCDARTDARSRVPCFARCWEEEDEEASWNVFTGSEAAGAVVCHWLEARDA